jgi:GT2 family glycosyltransferase
MFRMADAVAEEAGLVAVIIVTRNRRDLLLACLDAVERLRHSPVASVVVDNGSSDGSAAAVAARHPGTVVLAQPRNLGVAGGRNVGLAWALDRHRAAYLLFIDDDTLLAPDSVGELVSAIRADPGIGLVAPKAYRRPGERTLASAGGMRFSPFLGAAWDVGAGEEDSGQRDTPCEIQACPGFAFFVRREVMERVGGFDEALNPYGWEDVELSLRAARAGFRSVYAPRAVVHHLGGRAGRGPVGSYERYKLRNMLRLVRRHATPAQLAGFAALLPFRAVYRVSRELARGNGAVVAAWVGGMLRSGWR